MSYWTPLSVRWCHVAFGSVVFRNSQKPSISLWKVRILCDLLFTCSQLIVDVHQEKLWQDLAPIKPVCTNLADGGGQNFHIRIIHGLRGFSHCPSQKKFGWDGKECLISWATLKKKKKENRKESHIYQVSLVKLAEKVRKILITLLFYYYFITLQEWWAFSLLHSLKSLCFRSQKHTFISYKYLKCKRSRN